MSPKPGDFLIWINRWCQTLNQTVWFDVAAGFDQAAQSIRKANLRDVVRDVYPALDDVLHRWQVRFVPGDGGTLRQGFARQADLDQQRRRLFVAHCSGWLFH